MDLLLYNSDRKAFSKLNKIVEFNISYLFNYIIFYNDNRDRFGLNYSNIYIKNVNGNKLNVTFENHHLKRYISYNDIKTVIFNNSNIVLIDNNNKKTNLDENINMLYSIKELD